MLPLATTELTLGARVPLLVCSSGLQRRRSLPVVDDGGDDRRLKADPAEATAGIGRGRARRQPSGCGTLLGMLALLAALCFILALFKVAVPFSLVTLGLALLAIHLAWPIAIWGRRSR